jgi:hypothetical protein
MWTYFAVLLSILALAVLVLALFAFLGRYKRGKYLAPIVKVITKVGFMRRLFVRMNRAQLERTNPELVSAMDKLQRLAGPNPDPQRLNKALWQLTPAERRAYLEAVNQQPGAAAEASNREMRRQQKRIEQGGGPTVATKGSGKRRR